MEILRVKSVVTIEMKNVYTVEKGDNSVNGENEND